MISLRLFVFGVADAVDVDVVVVAVVDSSLCQINFIRGCSQSEISISTVWSSSLKTVRLARFKVYISMLASNLSKL